MIRFNLLFMVIFSVSLLLTEPVSAARNADYDFSFSLPVPHWEADKTYLGLTGQNRFKMSQIQAKVVLIQIFSMYCPICQREAVHVNHVFEKIQNNRALNRDIRMIGIGAGNSGFEARFFRSNYKIKFPMFSDADFSIHKMVKQVGTPHFFGLKRRKNNTLKLIFSHSGPIPEPDKFVTDLVRAIKSEATP